MLAYTALLGFEGGTLVPGRERLRCHGNKESETRASETYMKILRKSLSEAAAASRRWSGG